MHAGGKIRVVPLFVHNPFMKEEDGMTRYVRMFFSTVALAMFCVVLMGAPSGAAEIYFEDDFNGAAIDSLKWDTDIATSGYRICTPNYWQHPDIWSWQDVSVEPCYGYTQPLPYGYINVINGEAEFYSGVQTTFPYIWAGPPARPSPFPPEGDFVFETRMKYKQPLTYYIAGMTVAQMENHDPVNKTHHTGEGVFYIWGYVAGVYAPAIAIPITDSNYHVYRLEYTGGNYLLYVDNALKAGPALNAVRPNTIVLGISSITDAGPNNWSDFTIDYVRVTVPGLSCVQPPTGMIGWWPGDGNSNDIVGGNHGSIVGGMTYAFGEVGQSFNFVGNNYVSIPNNPSLEPAQFTVGGWVKPQFDGRPLEADAVDTIIEKYSNDGGYGLFVAMDPYGGPGFSPPAPISMGVPIFLLTVNGNRHQIFGSAPVPNDNSYHYVSATYDGIHMRIYIDGVEVENNSAPGIITHSGSDASIGYETLWPRWSRAAIDEVNIYSRALSIDEIRAIYLAGSAGMCKPANRPPMAHAGPGQTVEQTSCAGAAVTLDGSASSDPDGDALTYTWTENGGVIATGSKPAVTLSYGSHTITLTVDDGKGGTASDMVVINVVDTTAPALNVTLSPNVLWPPNHKYVKVTPSITVNDACVATTTVALISATSSEPDNGLGDGDTANDIVVNSDGTISLRAERSGKGSGRVYTITYQAADIAGNTATATATVTVPHNK